MENSDLLTCLSLNRTSHDILEIQSKKHVKFSNLILFLCCLTLIFALENNRIRVVFKAILINITSMGFFLIMSPLILPFFVTFLVYRKIVALILYCKLGSEKFGGLFTGSDAIWFIEDQSRSIINILMVIKFNENNFQLLNLVKNKIHTNIFCHPENFPKLLGTFHKFGGYTYLKKNELRLDNVVLPFWVKNSNNQITKQDLNKFLNEINNTILPRNHSALWETLVGQQKITWTLNDRNDYYPIIFRIHHSLSDGTGLLNVLRTIFADEKNVQKLIQLKKPKKTTKATVTSFCRILKIFFQAPSVVFAQAFLKEKDVNVLHGPKLSGRKFLISEIEESVNCVKTVKRIKNKIPSCKFSDVLLAVICKSFYEYFKMNSESNIPKKLTAVIPAILNENLIKPNEKSLNDRYFSNKFSVAMLDLPINLQTPTEMNFLRLVNQKTNHLRNGIDYLVNSWLLNVLATVFPLPMLKFVTQSSQSTLIISNLPGPSSVTIFDGLMLKDIVFWIPNRESTGLGLSILTYDGRFQIGLNVDRALISDENKAKNLLRSILNNFASIDCMINETVSK